MIKSLYICIETITNTKVMDLNELSALRAGVTLFAGAINEIARRAGCSQAYVTRTLKGEATNTDLTRKVIQVSQVLYEEKKETIEEYNSQLSLAN